mmetsp:Transcript_54079/g.118543  ORF Transcript_54079/g.118543 Transcript_54079/m.118543 type:complete len:265 (+) Transcript_54079:493-1287(+)
MNRDLQKVRRVVSLRLNLGLRVVKLFQTLSGKSQQLNSCAVLSRLLDVSFVLGLALLCRFVHSHIQIFNTLFQVLDQFRRRFDGFLQITCPHVEVLTLMLQLFPLVLGLVQLSITILLLRIVVRLLELESLDHILHHLDDLVEVSVSPLHSHRNQIQPRTGPLPPARRTECPQRPLLDSALLRPQLQQTGLWKSLFKELQRLIRIQNLDCVGNRQQLIGPSLLDHGMVFCFLQAVLLEVLRKTGVRFQLFFSVSQIILQLNNLH